MHVWQHANFCYSMVLNHVTEQVPRACVACARTAPDREQNVRFSRRPCAQPRNNRPLRLFHRCRMKLVRASASDKFVVFIEVTLLRHTVLLVSPRGVLE